MKRRLPTPDHSSNAPPEKVAHRDPFAVALDVPGYAPLFSHQLAELPADAQKAELKARLCTCLHMYYSGTDDVIDVADHVFHLSRQRPVVVWCLLHHLQSRQGGGRLGSEEVYARVRRLLAPQWAAGKD